VDVLLRLGKAPDLHLVISWSLHLNFNLTEFRNQEEIPDVFCGKRIYGRICHTQKGAEDMEQTYVPFPLLQVEDVELVLELFLFLKAALLK